LPGFAQSPHVMAALIAAIHVFLFGKKAWMAGTRPATTIGNCGTASSLQPIS
jgi:hypothetical protein